MVADDLPLGVAVRTTPRTNLLMGASGSGSIHGQADERAVVKSLIALGVTDGGDGCLAGDGRVQALGEVAQGVIAEAPETSRARRADERTRASIPAKAARRRNSHQ